MNQDTDRNVVDMGNTFSKVLYAVTLYIVNIQAHWLLRIWINFLQFDDDLPRTRSPERKIFWLQELLAFIRT